MAAPGRAHCGRATLAGLLAATVFFLLGWASAALLDPPAAPHAALGATVVDLAPAGLKDWAIATFGTADKVALAVVMVTVCAVLAVAIGLLGIRHLPWATAAVCLLTAVCAVCALTRPDADLVALVPSALAGVAGLLALHLLLQRAGGAAAPGDRRRFLTGVGATIAVSALVAAVGSLLTRSRSVTDAVREQVQVPEPVDDAPPIPPGTQVELAGMPPFVTPNEDFYRVDTAFVVPQVDPQDWQLRVHGLVDQEVRLTFDELLDAALVAATITVTCVSNTVGGDLAGNATWIGLPVRDVLARAGVDPSADMVLSRSVDGFTASTPLPVLTDDRDALLAVAMNGEPLPVEHGFPVRMVVPGLYGYVSATKWVTELEVTRFADATAYWTDRGWDPRGPIKTACRIDVPRSGSELPAGSVPIGGTAWAAPRGGPGAGAGGRGPLAGCRPGRHTGGGHLAAVVLHLGRRSSRPARGALPRLGRHRGADRAHRSPAAERRLRLPRGLRADQLTRYATAQTGSPHAPPSPANVSRSHRREHANEQG